MARSSIRYIDSESLYSGSYGKSQVVYGRFPKRLKANSSSVADKINKFLSSVLVGLVMLSLVSYYFVSDSQKTMNAIGKQIVALNNENIELQNKLDNLHSFNKVDEIIRGRTSLNAAKKVMEVEGSAVVADTQKKKVSVPVNYNWSVGY